MRLYITKTDNIAEEELVRAYNAMSDSRKEYVDRFKVASAKKARIVADSTARNAIASESGINPENIEFDKSSKGKPFAVNAQIRFSVSHSADIVICATSEKEIGADIEKIREIRFETAKRFASAEELEYIKQNKENYFKIWTLKEAYFKCIGTGLSADIKSVVFSIDGNRIACSQKGFNFRFCNVDPDYICAVCEKSE